MRFSKPPSTDEVQKKRGRKELSRLPSCSHGVNSCCVTCCNFHKKQKMGKLTRNSAGSRNTSRHFSTILSVSRRLCQEVTSAQIARTCLIRFQWIIAPAYLGLHRGLRLQQQKKVLPTGVHLFVLLEKCRLLLLKTPLSQGNQNFPSLISSSNQNEGNPKLSFNIKALPPFTKNHKK